MAHGEIIERSNMWKEEAKKMLETEGWGDEDDESSVDSHEDPPSLVSKEYFTAQEEESSDEEEELPVRDAMVELMKVLKQTNEKLKFIQAKSTGEIEVKTVSESKVVKETENQVVQERPTVENEPGGYVLTKDINTKESPCSQSSTIDERIVSPSHFEQFRPNSVHINDENETSTPQLEIGNVKTDETTDTPTHGSSQD